MGGPEARGFAAAESAEIGAGTDSISAMRRPRYEAADYHLGEINGVKSAAPQYPQEMLDSSIRIKFTSPRRIAFDGETGEISIFDQTFEGVFHGHVRTWDQLTQEMKNTLIKEKIFTPRGVPVGP